MKKAIIAATILTLTIFNIIASNAHAENPLDYIKQFVSVAHVDKVDARVKLHNEIINEGNDPSEMLAACASNMIVEWVTQKPVDEMLAHLDTDEAAGEYLAVLMPCLMMEMSN